VTAFSKPAALIVESGADGFFIKCVDRMRPAIALMLCDCVYLLRLRLSVAFIECTTGAEAIRRGTPSFKFV
jgi:hypothetical protein